MNVNWDKFTSRFHTAFNDGDVATLEELKKLNIFGFCNLNDLGRVFIKYDAGLYKWTEMIEDAKKNKVDLNQITPIIKWETAFREAFDKGNLEQLKLLDQLIINDRTNFGPGLEKYENQITPEFITDVKKNHVSWCIFCDNFMKAFYTGNIKTLNLLKSINIYGFNNLSDLGPQFTKYGDGFSKWDIMLQDATLNIL